MDITQLRPIDLSLRETKPSLIAVSPTVSIQTALTLMNSHRFTSLPIFSHDCTKVVSIVNLFDILLYLMGDLTTVQKDKFPLGDPVENVLGLDADRESYRMYKTDQHDKLLETFRVFASGGHRALVVDETDESKHPWLLSQSDIMRHIVHHPECISELIDINKSIQELGFVDKDRKLITIQGRQQSALHGYRLMAKEKLSGIPILDEQGQFAGDLCLEDLPGANLDMIDLLDLKSVDYLKKLSHHEPSTADRNTSLKDIIDIMVNHDTHRVWILDEKKVVGVVTMSDILGRLSARRKSSIF
ncbi:uncharacterized protein BX664DRAFT_329098 [Halteromyces radiatus]|uniref:uncharacterized protein n=1 Tax=Halteromyces radiatus TaxID=101107 RepID=UPI0022210007|nr:uncharacterized protein BX664DRAFT_329098 [Halteromyces radiatus]KAI8093176.1 hypothetical protein BX664DRAFT_329098 [Halteromyces radiatus]